MTRELQTSPYDIRLAIGALSRGFSEWNPSRILRFIDRQEDEEIREACEATIKKHASPLLKDRLEKVREAMRVISENDIALREPNSTEG